jgi:hypothetical protein
VYGQAPVYVIGQAPAAAGYTVGAAPTVAGYTVGQAPVAYSYSYAASGYATGSAPAANVMMAPTVGAAPNGDGQDSVIINGQVYDRRSGSSAGVGASPGDQEVGAAPVNSSVRSRFQESLREFREELKEVSRREREEEALLLLAEALGINERELTAAQEDYAIREVRRLVSDDEPEKTTNQGHQGHQGQPQVLIYSAPAPQPMVMMAPSPVVPLQFFVPVVPTHQHKTGKFFGR